MGLFNIEIKNKRIADIISIESPTKFRESMKELKKGYFTNNEKKSLVLAQNRARAILNKKNLSEREKKQFIEISKIKI